jgi:DNA-binding transcriptional LysR family regulator
MNKGQLFKEEGVKRMDLHQLEAFSVIVREKSFSRAAEILHLTQPSISTRIANLEAEIEAELFIRDGRTIKLSKYGQLLEPYVQRILSLAQEAKTTMLQSKDEEKLHLAIGTTSRIATYLLPLLLERYQMDLPQVEVSIQTGLSEQVMDMLHGSAIHVGLLNDPPDDDRWDKLPLFKDHIVLVCSPEHPLYAQYQRDRTFSVQSLQGIPVINAKNPSKYHRPLTEWLRAHQIVSKNHISVDNIESMKRLAARKVGVAFLPRMAVLEEIRNGELIDIPFEQQYQFTRETFLVYQRQKYTNPALASFVQTIRQQLEQNRLDDL